MNDDERIEFLLELSDELEQIRSRGRAVFDNDLVIKRACERLVEVICDVTSHLSDEFQRMNPSLPYDEARGMRNVLAHQYERVSSNRLWGAVEQSVPDLATSLRSIARSRAVVERPRPDPPGLSLA